MRSFLRMIALVLLTLLAACGGGETAPTTATPAPSAALEAGAQGGADAEAAPLPEPEEGALLHHGSEAARRLGLDQVHTGDLDAMLERGYLRAAVAYSKTSYFMDGLRQRGAAYELLKQFEERLNERHDSEVPIKVVPIPATRAEMLEAVTSGRADLALGGLTITPGREEIVAFSDPLMTDVAEIVVTGPSAEPLSSLEDLAGRSISVRESSSYHASLLALNERFAAQGLPAVRLSIVEEYLEDEILLEMVDAGLIDAIVVDQYKAEFWDQIFENIELHPDLAVRTGGAIAWAFRQDSPLLAATVNEFVADHGKGTLMGNMLFNRYLRDTKYVDNALAEESLQRFHDAVVYFEEYAPQYEFDYLMMVAQGYQESKLDQSLVSHRGAVGIMQLLPTTAADDAVGIPNIDEPSANVHAGIRYMRWIRDTYFDDPAIDNANRTLLSFASYNAGPNRIRRLREKAAERGLDPNRWFFNVEIIAAEDIGRETVSYVENIYKYYAAYRLMLEREEFRAEQ